MAPPLANRRSGPSDVRRQERSRNPSTVRFAFAGFVLDQARGALLKNGREVPLRPKCFQVLQYLVERPEQLVRKDELLAAIWPDVVVTEDSLAQCLVTIRNALGDDDKTIVRTVLSRGIILDVPVTRLPARLRPRLTHWAAAAAVSVALAALLLVGTHQLGEQSILPEAGVTPANTIAVLPFKDLSPEGDQAYFAEGISEEVLNALAQNRDLTVIARTSSFAFRDPGANVETVARELGASFLLEGSVRREGDHVRVTTHLVDAERRTHLWSQTFDYAKGNVFVVQSDVARAVARVLQTTVRGEPESIQAGAPDPLAYEHYLRGKYFHNRRRPGDPARAMAELRRAVELDPSMARAWSALAGAIAVDGIEVKGLPWSSVAKPYRSALERALELDAGDAEANVRMARVQLHAGAYDSARSHFERAFERGNGNALVLSIAASLADGAGEIQTAVELQRRAVRLDPLGYVPRSALASYLTRAGELDEARDIIEGLFDLEPARKEFDLENQLTVELLAGRFHEARDVALQLATNPVRDRGLALVELGLGNLDAGRIHIERLQQLGTPESAIALAEVYAQTGNVELSLQWIEKAKEMVGADEELQQGLWRRIRMSPFLLPLSGTSGWEQYRGYDADAIDAIPIRLLDR